MARGKAHGIAGSGAQLALRSENAETAALYIHQIIIEPAFLVVRGERIGHQHVARAVDNDGRTCRLDTAFVIYVYRHIGKRIIAAVLHELAFQKSKKVHVYNKIIN